MLGIEPLPKLVKVFEQAMRATGWVKDTNVYIDYRWGGTDPEKTKAVAVELIDSGPSVIVTIGSPATVASQNATSSIPIVFAVVSDPVGKGIVTATPSRILPKFKLKTARLAGRAPFNFRFAPKATEVVRRRN